MTREICKQKSEAGEHRRPAASSFTPVSAFQHSPPCPPPAGASQKEAARSLRPTSSGEKLTFSRPLSLLPLALAIDHAVSAVAVGAEPFLAIRAVQDGKVIRLVLQIALLLIALHQLDPVVAAQAGEPAEALAVEDVGGRAIAARGPGFIGDMRVRWSVAGGTSDVGPRMDHRDGFLHEVQVAHLAATVVGP